MMLISEHTERKAYQKMTRELIIESAARFTLESPANYVSEEKAMDPKYVGMKMFEPPIFAFGAPSDDLYATFKSPEVVGSRFMLPGEWLPGAKTVISFFLPYTERIKTANSADFAWPAEEWLHGRIEGQIFLVELANYLRDKLTGAGYKSLVPGTDPRFATGGSNDKKESPRDAFTSSWSERHVAFACGLGTFGLSKGLITEKGTCGRFGSILTELDLEKDVRRYEGVYDYCIKCGACVPNCPAGAISPEGKDCFPCKAFIDKTAEKHGPRYGCGKCQVSVPCESAAPGM